MAYGTLVTTFGLEVVQVQEAAKGWDPATDVDGATATLIGAGQTLVSGTIWFGIVWLPLLVAIGLIALVVRFVGATPGGCSGPPRSGAAGWAPERAAATPSAGRAHAASAARARSRVRLNDGQPWSVGSARRSAARRRRNASRPSRSAAGRRSYDATTAGMASSPSDAR